MNKKIGLYKEKTCKGVQWRVRWFGEYNETTGKQKRHSKTFALRKDAERCIKVKDAEFERGAPRDPSKVTLKEYAERWLHNKTKIEGVRPSTAILYKLTLDRLDKYFGDCLLRKIDRRTAQSFLADLQPLQSAKSSLSGWSRHRVLRHCKTLFKDAVQDGATGSNPFKGIKGEKCVTSQWYYLKPDGYLKLLDATPSLSEKVLYALCYTAGLRLTEALTLRWVDVDFEKGRVHVVNQPETQTLPPFNIKDSDARTIPIPKHTLDLLAQLQVESPDGSPYVLLAGERYSAIRDKWGQCSKAGKPWLNRYWANNIPRNFQRRVRAAGIDAAGKKLTVHILRKCCLQNWMNYAPMNVVKNLAGHSSIETTERFYSQVDESHLDNVAKVADMLFDKAGAEKTDLFLTFSPDLGHIENDGQASSCVKPLKTQKLQIESS
jgi:integrase